MIHLVHRDWQVGGVERTNLQWAKVIMANGNHCRIHSNPDKHCSVDWPDVRHYASLIELKRGVLTDAQSGDTVIICQSSLIRHFFKQILLLRLKGARVVLAERNGIEQYNQFPVKRFLFTGVVLILSPIFFRIICNSEEMAKQTPFRYLSNVRTVINPRFDGVELAALTLNTSPVKEFCFIGRWSRQKGIDFLEEAIPAAIEKGFKVNAFCGKTDLAFQRPFIEDVVSYLAEKPVGIIFCSKFEGYPNILIEARTIGVPVIFSMCATGVAELLDGYDLAFEFERGSVPSFLSAVNRASNAKVSGFDEAFYSKHLVCNSNLMQVLRI